jgi:hypothetical protein
MFCPRCKCEYREGFTTCADCEIKLVECLPAEISSDDNQNDLETVFETFSQSDIMFIKSALDAAVIPYYFSGEFFHMMGVRPTSAQLLVPTEKKEQALTVLRELQLIE